ncbi:MAG: class I SAM-dependent RNA methyltransferase [Deltaproteobacteria bacterium]|nr:class I SAM-dependent RNA methyltransferase [Deltaproteobacteria bacterium]
MSIWNQKSKILVTCAKGIPPYLRTEIQAAGLPVVEEIDAAVETEGALTDAMSLNLTVRTGQRVLFLLQSFRAENAEDLYGRLSRMPWEEWLHEDGYVAVTSVVNNPSIRDSRFANLKCKDAIVDRMQKACGRRPDSGPERDKAVIHLHWRGDRASIYFDTSGESLSKRNYRKIPLLAPVQESLAAALIMAARWDGTGSFINPMCGSGTLAIEAALIALYKAPGLLRTNFGFMHIKGFPLSHWQDLRKQVRESTRKAFTGKIIATDVSREAVDAARQNARTAGVESHIDFGVYGYEKTPIPEGGGIIMLNPPYGERMGDVKRLGETYHGIGDFFKFKGRGYRGYIFTGNLDLAKQVGLRTMRRIPFYNGEIECRLLEYDLYEGSHKAKKEKEDPGSHVP